MLNFILQEGSILTVLYVILCTYIVSRGANESNLFNYVFTAAKLVTLIFIAFAAFTYFDVTNYSPFFLSGGF